MKEKLLAKKTNILRLLTSDKSSSKTKVAMSKIISTAEEQDKSNEQLLHDTDAS